MTKTLLLVIGISAVACTSNSSTEQHSHIQENTVSTTDQTTDQTTEVHTDNAVLGAVYTQYLLLAEALVVEDEAAAKKSANAIAAAFNEAGKTTEAALAGKIVSANSIDGKRTAFHDLSNTMINWVKAEKLTSGNVYIAHCPMAFNDTGASWLTAKKEIRNPYYGDAMLKCGSITETLN